MRGDDLTERLISIVGPRNVLTQSGQTGPFRTGFRTGSGVANAVVFPGTLLEQWYVLQACVDSDTIVIMQAANTGLTEGSTPNGSDYDRDVVIVNSRRLTKSYLLGDASQVLCFSGTSLHSLESLLKPHDRSPHSQIGSSCIGASVVGGVANNSGGSLVNRGPAYTELALFARIDQHGELQLVNNLEIEGLSESPDELLKELDDGRFQPEATKGTSTPASDTTYVDRLRDVDADSPSRFNADKRRLFDASGCAGKVAVFAVRLDTFPNPGDEEVFYVGANDPHVLSTLRRDILSTFTNLPITAEYMHRDCFDLAAKYGKDSFLLINTLGVNFMPTFFRLKRTIDETFNRTKWLPSDAVDRALQWLSRFFPQHLPSRLLSFRDRYEHHIILKAADAGIEEARIYLSEAASRVDDGQFGYFECEEAEASKAYLHRFVAASAAIRYGVIHRNRVGDVLSLDVALKRNDQDWHEALPSELRDKVHSVACYGHFLCHVFHRDYVIEKTADTSEVKSILLNDLDHRGGKYPAEHNVGHVYKAEKALADFYRQLDPTNSFNPGIGHTSKLKHL